VAQTLHLEIVTPERMILDEHVDRVEVPGLNGELGILPEHAELISELKPAGLLTYQSGERRGQIAVSDGFVEVSHNRVTVLADSAARPEDIDLGRALAMKETAEMQLQKSLTDPEIDIAKATAQLDRARIELQLAGK